MPRIKKDTDESSGSLRHSPPAGPAESLAKKLGVKPDGMAIALLWAPEGFAARLGIEEGNYDTDLSIGTYDLIIFFTASRVLLREFFPITIQRLEPEGKIWICWPKRSENQKTDLTLDIVHQFAESLDLIENNRSGIDEQWTGIKFKKGVAAAPHREIATDSIAPYSISTMSSIPITPDETPEAV
jgi:hypothetical protein